METPYCEILTLSAGLIDVPIDVTIIASANSLGEFWRIGSITALVYCTRES
jgi:hypothetical protein